MGPQIARSRLGAGLLLLAACCASPVAAAKLENTFYAASTTVFLKVPDAALRKLLPAGWEPAAVPAMQGGNLTVTFSDILAAETGDGRPGATALAVWLAAPIRRNGTGERAGAVLTGLASQQSFVPGPYGNYARAQAHLDRRRQIDAAGGLVSEQWQFIGDNGATIEMRLAFVDGPARHLKPPPSRVVSATKPNLERVNRTEVVAQQLRPDDANSVREFSFAAKGPLLSSLFDGSQRVTAIVHAPWLMTQVLVP